MPAPHDRTDATIRVRAWGTEDPRLIPDLAYENQAGAGRRRAAIGERAATAGWPAEQHGTENTARNRVSAARRRREARATRGAPHA